MMSISPNRTSATVRMSRGSRGVSERPNAYFWTTRWVPMRNPTVEESSPNPPRKWIGRVEKRFQNT